MGDPMRRGGADRGPGERAEDGVSIDPRALDRGDLARAAAGWDNRLYAAALGVAVLAASAWPAMFEGLTSRFGVRLPAVAFALGSLVAAARADAAPRALAGAFVAGLCASAAATGGDAPLRLLPSFVHAAVSAAFFASLRGESSAVERGARMIQPMAPPFIGPYCRRVTALWGLVLLVNAAALAWAALFASTGMWRTVAGAGIWGWMAAVSAVEFLVRKTYFRNYWYGGPFERVWSRMFPAEATEMGRRSAEWIRVVRREMEAKDRSGA